MPLTAPLTDHLSHGWGRAAVSRFSKTPEQIQAEIMRALEGKISVEFQDYSQWQRVAMPQTLPLPVQYKPPPKTKKKPPSTRPLTGASGTSCSSLCLHPWNKKPPPVDHTAEIEARERIAIIKLQIDAKEKSVLQYRELCDFLQKQNKALRKEIDEVSANAHNTVTQLLEKYESYSGASKTMKRTHAEDEIQAQHDLNITSKQLHDELHHLEEEVLTLDTQLQKLLEDLQILRTYKNKEYPVKSIHISRLGKDVEGLALKQKFETDELERIAVGEITKLQNYRKTKMKAIIEDAAEEAFNSLVPARMQHMAWHNSILKQEVDNHLEEIREREREISALKQDVRKLKQTPQTHVRSFVFPEAYLTRPICHPDEDVILDIPTQKALPF